MRTSVYLSFLLCALPVLSAKYRIRDSAGNCITTTHEPHGRVITRGDCFFPDTILNVDVEISREHSTYGSVSKDGRFIGRSEDGKYLEWVDEKYNWEFPPVHGTPFHNVHVRGHDDYWVEHHEGTPITLGKRKAEWYFAEV